MEGKTRSGEIGDPARMLEILRVLLPTLTRLFPKRQDLVVENLLLRHQLQVAFRSRPRPHLKAIDRILWLAVRSVYPGWRRHLILVQPETVIRWHREAGASTGAGAQACRWAGQG